MGSTRHRSFSPTGADTVATSSGALGHRDMVAHTGRLAREMFTVRPGVWCLMGNGLSNQTFVDAPEGIIAIDTGESIQEMAEALGELRRHTSRPIAAVLYTHFHYVAGTKAVLDDAHAEPLPVWSHSKVPFNRARTATEIAPAYGRGLSDQFGVALPTEGSDGLINVGLGRFYRNPAHAPFTNGYVPPTHTFDGDTNITVAGTPIEVIHSPSDADDSVTYWFPSLGVCVNNSVWPALFNIYAIRGEEYRDPRGLITGLDRILALGAEHLVGAHGPPVSGAADIARRVTLYRDSIQYLWDQTVRHVNKGLTGRELARAVRLPDFYDEDYLTSEFYGVAEHHVRQIQTGLFGFFDGDEANLFPLDATERCDRLIEGFGGRDPVRAKVRAAIDGDDLRWALELGSWLVRGSDPTETDRLLLAEALRAVARRTPAANIRNWCLARARGLDGSADRSRFFVHRFNRSALATTETPSLVHVLRVLLDPDPATGLDVHVGWEIDGVRAAGLHIRNCVACPTDGRDARIIVRCDRSAWIDVLTCSVSLADAVATGRISVEGDAGGLARAMDCFELASLRSLGG